MPKKHSKLTQVPSLKSSLTEQIENLKTGFPKLPDVLGVLLCGSCSTDTATYRSDIDLLVILKDGQLTYDRVKNMRDVIENSFIHHGLQNLLTSPLPVQLNIVMENVFRTSEPAMREALKKAVIFLDPDCLLKEKISSL